MKATHSLQRRLLTLVIGLVAAVWIGTAVLTWIDVRHELDELLDAHLAQAAALLVAQQAQEPDDDRQVDAPSLHRYAPKVVFQVFHDGRLALRSANAPAEPIAGLGRLRSGFATVALDGQDWRVFATHGAEADVQVYVGEQLRSRTSILRAVLRSTLEPMAVALPLLALGAWWAVRHGTVPLRRLGAALAERRSGDLRPLTIGGMPSEILPVTEALNGLFERIGALLEGERRFTADAAHELRTPIAAIRAQAQVALGEPDAALRRHALQNTLQGCDRAARLVDQLLTLARLEADALPPLHAVELAALTRSVVAELAPKALGKRQALELDAPAPCPVAGDETLLAVLVRNLVDNAVRYAPVAARIAVALRREGETTVLTVEDSGNGLSDADLARLGERFFRAPGGDESGSGLGWSIARRIAAVHQAELQAARSDRLGGLAVRVVFGAPATRPA